MTPEERARIALGKIYFQQSTLDCDVAAIAAAIREAVAEAYEHCAQIALDKRLACERDRQRDDISDQEKQDLYWCILTADHIEKQIRPKG